MISEENGYWCCEQSLLAYKDYGNDWVGCAPELPNAARVSTVPPVDVGDTYKSMTESDSTVLPTATTTPTSYPNSYSSSSSNAGAIAGGVVGGVAGLALIFEFIWSFIRRRRQQQESLIKQDTPQMRQPTPEAELDGKCIPGTELDGKAVRAKLDSGVAAGHELPAG
ncbi:hypothetical protein BDW62DRAFT_190641 [Aspergillus aurantiobrunneus]